MRGAIWLVGMMGAGKSTVGPPLAARLRRRFVDTDDVIVERAGKSIAAIFAEDGEAAFRALEADVVAEAGAEGAVVAVGGGAVAEPGAAERLAHSGTLVYLRARPETLIERIGDPASRPLLAELEPEERVCRIRALLREREPAYATAKVIVDVDEWDEAALAEQIGERLTALEREQT